MAIAMAPPDPNTHGVRPVPDPSALTTQQLIRELTGLRELIEARLDGMDVATRLIQGATERLPSEMDVMVNHLRTLNDERFRSIQVQFEERDTRTDQTARDTKLAVDAALQAAEKAVNKSEVTTTKQIEQIGALIASETRALNDKIVALASRQDRQEGQGSGFSTSWSIVVAVIGTLLGIGGLALALLR